MWEAGCKDVVVEQHLIPTKGDHLRARTEKGDRSRMNIAATGVFSPSLMSGKLTPTLPPTGLSLWTSSMWSTKLRRTEMLSVVYKLSSDLHRWNVFEWVSEVFKGKTLATMKISWLMWVLAWFQKFCLMKLKFIADARTHFLPNRFNVTIFSEILVKCVIVF